MYKIAQENMYPEDNALNRAVTWWANQVDWNTVTVRGRPMRYLFGDNLRMRIQLDRDWQENKKITFGTNLFLGEILCDAMRWTNMNSDAQLCYSAMHTQMLIDDNKQEVTIMENKPCRPKKETIIFSGPTQ